MNVPDDLLEVQRHLANLVSEGRLARQKADRLMRLLRRELELTTRHLSSLAAFVDGVLLALDQRALIEGTHYRQMADGNVALVLRSTWVVVARTLVAPGQRAAARRFLREPIARQLGVVAYQARARFGPGVRHRVLLLNLELARAALNRPAVPA